VPFVLPPFFLVRISDKKREQKHPDHIAIIESGPESTVASRRPCIEFENGRIVDGNYSGTYGHRILVVPHYVQSQLSLFRIFAESKE
jgi:hypothetical protein